MFHSQINHMERPLRLHIVSCINKQRIIFIYLIKNNHIQFKNNALLKFLKQTQDTCLNT